MTCAPPQFVRVLNVSEYYRYIIKSQLLIPDFAKPLFSPNSGFAHLLNNIDHDTVNKIRGYHLDIPEKKSDSFKAFILAMLCVQRNKRYQECIEEFEQIKGDCLSADGETSHYRYNFSMMYLTLGTVDKCVSELVDTVQLFPDFGQAHAALALLYTINEDWSKGLVHARKALARNAEIRPQLVDLCLSSCSYNLNLPVEGAFDYSVFDSSAVYNLEESLSYLPVVDVEQFDHSDHRKKILFVYADEKYFYEHVLALVCSLRETAADWVVHLHICNPSAKLEQDLHDFQNKVSPLEIRYSCEHGDLTRYGDARLYHSCVRFCRLFQMVSNNSNTVVMVDADMLIRNTPDSLSGIDDVDKVIGLTKTECEPYWATIRAGFCFFKRCESSLSFLGELSQFIIDNLRSRKGHWFIDQMGLSILYSKITDHSIVMLLPASECCDSTISDKSTIWAVVNDKSSLGKYNLCKNEILKLYGLK